MRDNVIDKGGLMEVDPVLAWQVRNLPALKAMRDVPPCSAGVTLVTNWLWSDGRFDALLDSLLAAILMTWRSCGRIPVVLVVNRVTPALFAMTDEWGVRLLVEPQIQGGGGNGKTLNPPHPPPGARTGKTLNRGVILNASRWVDTEYVLTFQNHAFPIRPGLQDFLGEYDYIGAPWVFGKDDWITRLLLRRNGDVGNGAFSLRSRRLCETVSWYYRRKY